MGSITIKSAHYIRAADCVVIDGNVEGIIRIGDVLCNNENRSETYYVKGFALLNMRDITKRSIDIQLHAGAYEPESLIGKTLIF